MIKRTKKGFTLVELIICCAIMTMLAGACTALLMSGEKLFSTGSQSALTQMDVNVLQTTLLKQLPPTQSITVMEADAAAASALGTTLFFDSENDGIFTIRYGEKNVTIQEICSFQYSISEIGNTDTARTQFSYTTTCKDGTTYTGGVVLSTMKYPEGPSQLNYYLVGSEDTGADDTIEAKAVNFQ